LGAALAIVLVGAPLHAQSEPQAPAPPAQAPPPEEPRFERFERAPNLPEPEPPPQAAPPPRPPPPSEPPPKIEPRSEGRILVSAYNEGFQWGISPGVVISGGDAGFALGVSISYGIDLDSVIVVPGVHGSVYFLPNNVWIGMPTAKLIVPIDRVGPFVEGGAGYGLVSGVDQSGLAWMAGGGIAVYFTHFAIGAEASYQAITGTDFHGWGIGPILAIGF
jgi:hypothetical protein